MAVRHAGRLSDDVDPGANLRWLTGLNPMTWVIDFSRWALLGTALSWGVVALSIATTLVLLVSGLYYFRRVEHFFADVI